MNSEFSHLFELDVPQKLDLIGALWRSIEDRDQPIDMPDSLVAELDRRKAAALADPSSLVPWETIKERIGLRNGETE
jgi:putative addiction module component (TIGR02574 family)